MVNKHNRYRSYNRKPLNKELEGMLINQVNLI